MLTQEQQELVLSVRAMAIKLAKESAGRFLLDPDELIAESWYQLCTAVRRFDPGRGVKWVTYAHATVRLFLIRYTENMNKARQQEVLATDLKKLHKGDFPISRSQLELIALARPERESSAKGVVNKLRRHVKGRILRMMLARFGEGKKLREIAAEHGISRERVRQLLFKYMQKLRSCASGRLTREANEALAQAGKRCA